jgi:hypothetical protein
MHRRTLRDSQEKPFSPILPTGRRPVKCELIDKKEYNRKYEPSQRKERLKRCKQRVGHPFFPCKVRTSNAGVFKNCESVKERPEFTKVEPYSTTEMEVMNERTSTKSNDNSPTQSMNNSSSSSLVNSSTTSRYQTRSKTAKQTTTTPTTTTPTTTTPTTTTRTTTTNKKTKKTKRINKQKK